MKKISVVFSLIFCFLFAQAQKNSVYVTEWINKPKEQDFKKPLIFIDFWATWCAPCIAAMPTVKELEKTYHNDVLFFYLSNEPKHKIEKFMEKRSKEFFSAVDNSGKNIDNFKIESIPQSVLLDCEGNVIWKGKPTEMNKRLLRRFRNSYLGKYGNTTRVVENKEKVSEIFWKTFKHESTVIKYVESDEITNDYSIQGHEYSFSGEINELVSIIFDVPKTQVVSYLEKNKKYILNCNADDLKSFKKALKKFLFKECNIDIAIRRKKQRVYILKETDSPNFFSKDMYDYEKGDNTFIADDLSITIDNASVEDMTVILSDFSEFTFIYFGKDDKKYDWNIHYKDINVTLNQLTDELGFNVTPDEKRLKYYYIMNRR